MHTHSPAQLQDTNALPGARKIASSPTKLRKSPMLTGQAFASNVQPNAAFGASLSQGLAVASWVTARVAQGQSLTMALVLAQQITVPTAGAALRGAAQDLAFAAQRQRGVADALILGLTKKPLDTLDPGIFALLRVVFAQLCIPNNIHYESHTLVNQAVEAVACVLAFGASKQPQLIQLNTPANRNTQAVAGFVNAVLRTFLRERAPRMLATKTNPLAVWNHPEWWVKQLKRDYPTRWEGLLSVNQTPPSLTLRVNARMQTAQAAQAHLAEHGIASQIVPGLSHALVLDKALPVHQIPKFEVGWYSVQDAAAQAGAAQLKLASGLKVLDACAAPGGKSAQIVEWADVHLTAIDSDPVRLEKVAHTMQRLSSTLPQTVTSAVRLIAADAAQPSTWWDGELFDRILLDAPCSASGVVRRHSDIRWLRRESDVATLQHQQSRLLNALWPLLKVNGYLLYVTCSVFVQEGEAQIQRFCEVMNQQKQQVKRCPSLGMVLPNDLGLSLEDGQKSGNLAGLDLVHVPMEQARWLHDGFYYALLQKIV